MIHLFGHLLDPHSKRHALAAAPLLPALLSRLRFRLRPAAEDAPSLPAGLTVAQQAAHADRLHRSYAVLADAQRRPVNGRSLGTLPRLTTPDHPPWDTAAFPVYGEASQLDVAAAEEQAAAEHAANVRAFMPRMSLPTMDTLRRVRDALGRDVPDATGLGEWR